MRYPTAWCAEIRPRPTRSTPPISISPTGRKPRPPPPRAGASLHSAGRLPRPLVAPLRSKSPRCDRVRRVACERRDGSRHRADPRVRGAHRAVLLPAPLVEPLVSVGTRFPPKPPEPLSPRGPRRPRPSSRAQSCKRSRLKKFFSPVVRAAPTAKDASPRPSPGPQLARGRSRSPTGPKKDSPTPQPAPRRIAEISPHPKRSPTAPTRATEREADHGKRQKSPRDRRGDGDGG